MHDWKPGDKAVRVKNNDIISEENQPKIGSIYEVKQVMMIEFGDLGEGLGLYLPDAPPNTDRSHVWYAGSFRPVIHDKQEKCEEEFLALLKRGKVRRVQSTNR